VSATLALINVAASAESPDRDPAELERIAPTLVVDLHHSSTETGLDAHCDRRPESKKLIGPRTHQESISS
jgi:hypothetical protein